MNIFKKLALQLFSSPDFDLRRNYQRQRELLRLLNRWIPETGEATALYFETGERIVPVRLYTPKAPPSRSAILFFHGGGWVTKNSISYDRLCARLSTWTRRPVLSVDYRLAPEHPFPAGLNDCYRVAKDLFQQAQSWGYDAGQITLMGDSAGGNLAAVVALKARESGDFEVKSQILVYPSTGWDHSDHAMFDSLRENGSGYGLSSKMIRDYMALYVQDPALRSHPHVAPLLAQDLSGQPRTLVLTAEYDPLRDEGEAYARRLLLAGNDARYVRVAGAWHGFMTEPWQNKASEQAFREIEQFFELTPQLPAVQDEPANLMSWL